MIVYLNGRFVPEEQACVSIHDRGFLYGDGLFETIRVYDGGPFLWAEHMARLYHGCDALNITPPLTGAEMLRVLTELLRRNRASDAIARLALTRGSGPRGYSPRGADYPTLAMTLFQPAKRAASYKVITSSLRLPAHDPLSSFKHGNKLRQVLARAEADADGANEALLLNDRNEVVEGTSTNLFWIDRDVVCTPPLDGILPGTTRNYLLARCADLGIRTREARIKLPALMKTSGAFVTSCGIEVMEISHINGHKIASSPLTQRLRREYR
jgi:branched-chain amino acid aminotransferase